MTALWDIVQDIVQAEGLELFDLEVPRGPQGGTLRVFISRAQLQANQDNASTQSGIRHEDCLSVSRKLLDHPEIENLIPGNVLIEVSSPGVNRKLTRPEHYSGACGERVKLNLTEPFLEKRVLRGILLSCTTDFLQMDLEEGLGQQQIPRSLIERARVDFDFETKGMRRVAS